jgi:hypothetical protein
LRLQVYLHELVERKRHGTRRRRLKTVEEAGGRALASVADW